MPTLNTKIGLEIHVQLATKSKMFCGCDNDAQGKAPNTNVCPVCLGLPGTLPVMNKQAILWTIKTGLALNCEINKISKFDRKHYFYPDLPKGYQISQYDEPLCKNGYVEVDGVKIRINRIHQEEDAGKLIHSGHESLVDLNRAGTPLMEIVTEPDITSAKQAGDFLRKLQKIVKDVVAVSEASMEKGHLRCDANISVNDGEKMSQIVEIKNLNSFRFVEKALVIEEEKLKEKYPDWPEKTAKETHGYNSETNETYIQRQKEEAADYRYFPEPDLPPIDTSEFDIEALRAEFNESEEEKIADLVKLGVAESEAKVIAGNKLKSKMFGEISVNLDEKDAPVVAKAIVHNYFGFEFTEKDIEKVSDYSNAIEDFIYGALTKNLLTEIAREIHNSKRFYREIKAEKELREGIDVDSIVSNILNANSKEVDRYRGGEKQLLGFFMGLVMKETKGKANPQEASKILKEKLEL